VFAKHISNLLSSRERNSQSNIRSASKVRVLLAESVPTNFLTVQRRISHKRCQQACSFRHTLVLVHASTTEMALGRAGSTFLILAAIVLCVGRYLKSLEEQLAVGSLKNEQSKRKKTMTHSNSVSRVSPSIAFVDTPVACNLGAAYPIPNATACAIFYPARFFEAASQSDFYESSFIGNRPVFEIEGNPVIHLERNKYRNTNAHAGNGNNNDKRMYSLGVPESITYLHNRKVGGSTMHSAFRLNKANSSLGLHVTLSWKMRNQMGLPVYHEAWNGKLSEIAASQHNEASETSSSSPAVVFTFVRCPVQRFLSAVGQLLSARHRFDRHFYSCDPDQTETTSTSDTVVERQSLVDTQRLLQCTLGILEKSVQANGPSSFMDVHLEPQVYQIRTGVNSMDVGIMILDLKHISSVLSILRPRSANLHKRSSTSKKYTGGYDLSTAGVVTDELVQQICRIYAVDVQMLQLASVSPTLCI
jgi:hypothetical protein